MVCSLRPELWTNYHSSAIKTPTFNKNSNALHGVLHLHFYH